MTRPLSVAYKEKVGDVSIQGTVFTSVPSRVSPSSDAFPALPSLSPSRSAPAFT